MSIFEIKIIEFDKLESTQEYAKDQLQKGFIGDCTAIVAKVQTKGRGRYDHRSWKTPEGNLAITICLRTPDNRDVSQVCYVAGNAVHQTLSTFLPNYKVELKWVNDIIVVNKKIGGILIEKVNDFLLIGIGVNLVSNPAFEEFNGISVQDLGSRIEYKDFLKDLTTNLINHYNLWNQSGFSLIRNYWIRFAYNLGKDIKVNYSDKTYDKGIFVDIDDEGKLILDDNGTIKKIETGELFLDL